MTGEDDLDITITTTTDIPETIKPWAGPIKPTVTLPKQYQN